MVCGATSLSIMLLDVLSGFDTIKLCTGYRLSDGTVTDRFIPDARRLAAVEPIYETVEGWSEDLTAMTTADELPDAAHGYLQRIADFTGVDVRLVSVGPDRAQTIRYSGAPVQG